MQDIKKCSTSKCGYKTIDSFYKSKSQKDGLNSCCNLYYRKTKRNEITNCIKCDGDFTSDAIANKRYTGILFLICINCHLSLNDSKYCSSCLEAKSLLEFNHEKGDSLKSKCKSCDRQHAKNNYHKYKDKKREYKKEYRLKNAELLKKKKDEYYINNLVLCRQNSRIWRENNKDKKAEIDRNWAKRNPDKLRINSENRRAREINAEGVFSLFDIKILSILQQNLCYYCFINLNNGYHVEHMIPLSRGGSNWPENLALSCATCNRRKHTKTAEEFIEQLNKEKQLYNT